LEMNCWWRILAMVLEMLLVALPAVPGLTIVFILL